MSLGLLATCELPLYSRVTWCLLNIRWQCKLLITLHKLISLQLLYEGQTDMDYNKHKIILTTEKRPVSLSVKTGIIKISQLPCGSLLIPLNKSAAIGCTGNSPCRTGCTMHSSQEFIHILCVYFLCVQPGFSVTSVFFPVWYSCVYNVINDEV